MAVSTKRLIFSLCAWVAILALPAFAGSDEPHPVAPAGGEDAWCASGSELDAYLDARDSLPRPGAAVGQLAVAPDPVVTSIDGVFVVEDSGVILRRDNVFDLPLESIELTPAGAGYQIASIPAAYEPLGMKDDPLWSGIDAWTSVPVSLARFAFPFDGVDRTNLWVTPGNLIAFTQPTAPVRVGLCSLGCFFDEGQVLLDRSPRISPLQHGTSFYGVNAWIREERDHVVVTWQYSDPVNMDVQAVLYEDGRIRFNYAALQGILHGAPVVITGNDAFWSDLRLGGDAVDPAGDVTIPAPDGPAMDIVSASARQVGETELLQVELTLAAPPPANNEERIFYQFELRDEYYDPPFGSLLLQWQNGQFYWMTEPVELDGATLRFNLRLFDLPLTFDSIHLTFKTFRGSTPYEQGDRLAMKADFVAPAAPLMLDLTEDLPLTLGDRPVYEAFTLPSLQTGEVLNALASRFEDASAVEGFPIYQNLWTDIIFFAGGYHAGGNAGADGIGFGSSASPRSPSLLHLNNIYNYGDEDWTMTVLSHELGHRWLYHFAIEENGQPSRSLNPAGSHPAGWVHTPAVNPVYLPLDYSVMGGSNWQDNGDGTFTSPPETQGGSNGFTWHELYLMGLAAPVEVEDWWYIDNAIPALPNAYWAPNDTTVLGDRVPVEVEQIIAVEGPRFPAYPDAPSDFLTPMVIVVRPGAFSQDDLNTVDGFCTTWQTRFQQATSTRGSVRCRFHPPVPVITDPPSNVTIDAGDTISFVGAGSDADGDSFELRWDFAGAAADATGPGPHPVTFDSTGTYPIVLDAADQTGLFAASPGTLQVTVECPTGSTPPTATVQALLLGKELGEIRFSWTDVVPAPADYVVLRSGQVGGGFVPAGDAASGSPGLLLPMPAGVEYYKVAARNVQGCLGPY